VWEVGFAVGGAIFGAVVAGHRRGMEAASRAWIPDLFRETLHPLSLIFAWFPFDSFIEPNGCGFLMFWLD
jgi:hypothetical protein